MATVNNWLAFSLSPQELPPTQTDSTLISAAATDDVSGDVCFNIPQGMYLSIDRCMHIHKCAVRIYICSLWYEYLLKLA
jgi:hypothetical protein